MSKRVNAKSKANVLGFDTYERDADTSANSPDGSAGSSLSFTCKHVYSTKNNPLCGITFFKWMQMLLKFGIWIEEWKYSSRIAAMELPDDPVFVIGHPRTGTTLVHNLLASDNDNFFYCTTFCAGFPSAFLWFEEYGKKMFASAMEKTRPMDSMPLHFDLPQEDELATNMMSAGCSYYMPLWLMKQEPYFRRYLDFSEEDGAIAADEREWTEAFLYMMKKLCLRNELMESKTTSASSEKRRLLLKSPVHTARVPLLRRLFPRAKFVYIHRNPDEVLLSMAHMLDTTYWYCYLNTPTNEQIQEFILWQFEHMWYKYDKAVSCTKVDAKSDLSRQVTDDVFEIGYKATTAQLKNTIKEIYEHIGIPWTDSLEQHFLAEEELLATYSPNVHNDSLLNKELKQLIRNRWGDYFDAFGYK